MFKTDWTQDVDKYPRLRPGSLSPIQTSTGLEHDPEDHSSDSEGEDDEPVVEVTEFKPSTSDEMLRLYFETPRKSGGGDLKTFDHDPKTGAIILTFENPSVAHSVVARSHRVDGTSLSVRQIVKKKPRPCPVKKRCLFLSGIPDGCYSELVTMFIEIRSGTDEFKIQYGEMPGTALCTFKEDIPDMENVIERFPSRTLQGAQVTAEKVYESDCILVQGVSPKASLEMIELYFGNKKKSGGTDVRDVQQGPTNTQAIVYFEDWKVIGNVLSKRGTHKVADTELLVEEYHERLGRLSPLDVPTPHVPKPVTVQVQEPIMEFIFGKGQHTKKALIQKLRDAKAILKWPDGDDKTTARLEPLLEDGQRQSSWLKWSEIATQVLTDFLNRCKSSRIAVPPPFWKNVIDRINQLGTYSFSIQPDAHTHLVTLVGEQQDVDKGRSDIAGVIEKLRAKAEYEAEQTKEDITFTEEKSKPFIICGIKDKIEKDFPNMTITVFSLQDKIRLVLEGSRKTVQEAELSMWRQMDSLEKVEHKTGRNKVKFVQNHTDKIHEILCSQGIRAACNGSDDVKIVISGATKKDTVQAKAYIDQEIEENVIPIKDQTVLSVLKSKEGRDLLDEIHKQRFTVVNINETEGVVQLAGFKTSLEEVKQSILEFLAVNVINKEFIEMSGSKMHVLLTRHGQSLDSLAKQQERNHLKIAPESGSRTGVYIQGNEEGLTIARLFVNSLAEGIKDSSPRSSSESDEQEEDSPGGKEEEEEEEEQFVEVTGFKKSSSVEMIKMHFENPRRSGGGDIKTWEHDPKTGVIRMTFENPSLASKVIARQHKLGGTNLMVQLIVKKKPRPRPVKKQCLFLSGIPDGCDSENVTMFIENRSGTGAFKIQYGEVPGTALCTSNEDISGISPRIPVEMIELYFGYKKKSGGTGVREVQQGPTDTQAVVYFEDWKVVGDVLSKLGVHKICGIEVSVQEYHECLGRLSHNRETSSISQIISPKSVKYGARGTRLIESSRGDIDNQSVNALDDLKSNAASQATVFLQTDNRNTFFKFKDGRSTGDRGGPFDATTRAESADVKKDECPICLADKMIDEVALRCNHRFCKTCIDQALKNDYKCPVCQTVCSQPKGNQPKGTMKHNTDRYLHLPGYEQDGVITIAYHIPSGTQWADHPNPGKLFTGTSRTAYLPDNQEGREVLVLLRKAFGAGLVFTVGRSITSGLGDTVIWNDIHHKTSMSGGPQNYGYPDPGYLKRVKEDLAAKGFQ
ncbi:uncharacterized protein LOC119740106 [Patiria miniata]|uniref:RING-type E3 ubiquitin transferase n=1 Tax=Patiria miniata TaxID=46514 RepID=A0A914B5Z3_PATMI|nr:uncharacterized protein LOC119740106 [Patiria miniata]